MYLRVFYSVCFCLVIPCLGFGASNTPEISKITLERPSIERIMKRKAFFEQEISYANHMRLTGWVLGGTCAVGLVSYIIYSLVSENNSTHNSNTGNNALSQAERDRVRDLYENVKLEQWERYKKDYCTFWGRATRGVNDGIVFGLASVVVGIIFGLCTQAKDGASHTFKEIFGQSDHDCFKRLQGLLSRETQKLAYSLQEFMRGVVQEAAREENTRKHYVKFKDYFCADLVTDYHTLLYASQDLIALMLAVVGQNESLGAQSLELCNVLSEFAGFLERIIQGDMFKEHCVEAEQALVVGHFKKLSVTITRFVATVGGTLYGQSV